MTKDKQRVKDLANARKKKQRQKQKEEKKNNVTVRKTADVREYNAQVQKQYRRMRYEITVTERNVSFIGHKWKYFVTAGLRLVRVRIDDSYTVFDEKGRQKKRPEFWNGSQFFFDGAKEVVSFGVLEAIGSCLKKYMLWDVDITLQCLNVVYALLDGSSWKTDEEISEEEETKFFHLVRRKCIGCDMVNTLLTFVEKTHKKAGSLNRETLIAAMRVMSILLSVGDEPTIVINMDAAKEFAVVSTIEHQLDIQQRGPIAYPIVSYGCEILLQFLRMFPDLRRNCTCQVIHRLLVDVYSLFVPEPYYFSEAIAVLNELLK